MLYMTHIIYKDGKLLDLTLTLDKKKHVNAGFKIFLVSVKCIILI